MTWKAKKRFKVASATTKSPRIHKASSSPMTGKAPNKEIITTRRLDISEDTVLGG